MCVLSVHLGGGHVSLCVCRDQRKTGDVLLSLSVFYSLETEFLTDPGTNLAASKPQCSGFHPWQHWGCGRVWPCLVLYVGVKGIWTQVPMPTEQAFSPLNYLSRSVYLYINIYWKLSSRLKRKLWEDRHHLCMAVISMWAFILVVCLIDELTNFILN